MHFSGQTYLRHPHPQSEAGQQASGLKQPNYMAYYHTKQQGPDQDGKVQGSDIIILRFGFEKGWCKFDAGLTLHLLLWQITMPLHGQAGPACFECTIKVRIWTWSRVIVNAVPVTPALQPFLFFAF